MDELTLEHRLSAVEDRAKSNTHRLGDVEKRQGELGELVTSISLIAQRQDSMERDVCEMKEDVKTLIRKPGRRFDSIVDKCLLALATALAGYVLIKLGIQL